MTMSAAGLGRLSRSASKIVAKAVNGFHLMRIDGYSQTKTILPGQKISSQDFSLGGRSWRIDYYPNGRSTSAKSNSDASSVYLQLTDHIQCPQQARYKFSLLNHAGNAAYELPAETASFTSVHNVNVQPRFNAYCNFSASMGPFASEEPGPGCGHEEFMEREELEKRRDDLIRDDRIVIRCDVCVAQIDTSRLAQDELSEEEEEEEDRPRRRGRQRRTDDDDYVKWCLTQEPGGSRGRRQGRAHGNRDW